MDRSGNLVDWIKREYVIAAREMLRSISATTLEHCRPAFGQTVRPARGSVLASPVSAHYDPEPDYFFHWLRDSAAVIGAVTELIGDGTLGEKGHAIVADFVHFSLGLDALDGRLVAGDAAYGKNVAPEVRQFLRPREEMLEIRGDRVRMEARFNPDGSLDLLRWGRPQFDGPAFRALTLMRHVDAHGASSEAKALIAADLDFTVRYAAAAGFDIWEERICADYYTHSLQLQLLAQSAAIAQGNGKHAAAVRAAALRLADLLDGHWSAERHAYLAAVGNPGTGQRDIDFAVVLAALHSGRREGPHSVHDPRMQATLATLEEVFCADYAINRDHPSAAPAMGRYRGDHYQCGGAFYFSTLGAAEFHYRLAETTAGSALERTPENARFCRRAGIPTMRGVPESDALALFARGDAFMRTVRRFTPPSGALSEQFDQTDGRQSSARHLAWSYAAFVTAAAARRRAEAVLGSFRHEPRPPPRDVQRQN